MATPPIVLKCNGTEVIVYPDKKIGEGGYSLIFEGRNRTTGEKLAVKAIHPSYNKNTILRERAKREGNILKFDHPNLVKMIGYADYGGNMFIVSEFIEGETLQEKIDRGYGMQKQQILQEIITPLLDVLEFLHNKKIVHRDVKASNLIIERNGNLRLIDMGISKIGFLPTITDPDNYPRTEHYASPEIIKGEPDLQPSTDLYSVGILLYQLLTNRLPFTHDNRYQLYKMILHNPLPHDNRIEQDMWVILHRLTRNEQKHRFQNVQELREALFPLPEQPKSWKAKWADMFSRIFFTTN